jgi:hypothetical protein
MSNLQFDTLDEANEAINKINRTAAANWRLQGNQTNGTTLISYNGGQTITWDTPMLVNEKYEINYPTEDTRYSKCDLHLYNLGLPINASGVKSGEHDMISIQSPAILGYSSEWFSVDTNGVMTFTCPDYGAFSVTSHYPRTELRHLTNYAYNENSSNTIKFSVESGVDNTKILVHQAHGEDETLYILSYLMKADGTGYLRAFVDEVEGQEATAITVKQNVKYGDITTVKAEIKDGKFYLYLDENVVTGIPNYTFNIGERVSNTYYYWKKGAYWANSANLGDVCIVKHYVI